MALETYRKKRKFDVTAEPRGHKGRARGNRYVIQKHDATPAALRPAAGTRRRHEELGGDARARASIPARSAWPLTSKTIPIEYNGFEGTIPEGEYGGGTVMIWDRGRWIPDGDPHKGYAKGHLDFMLDGEKLHGRWHLVRMRARKDDRHENWLLIKGKDEEARSGRGKDILDEKPLSVVSGRTMEEIAGGKGRKNVRQSKAKSMTPKPARGAERQRRNRQCASDASRPCLLGRCGSHQGGFGRILCRRVGCHGAACRQSAACHRALPGRHGGECFFQKHIASNIKKSPLRHAVNAKEHDVIAVEKLADLIALVQSAALKSMSGVRNLENWKFATASFSISIPGEGVGWKQIVAAAQEVRDRLKAEKLKSFVKLSGGKGVHVVVPIDGAGWDAAKDFTARIAAAMAADSPKLYLAKMTKALRKGKIFIDYLRNTREATSVAPYSTRARPGAPVSMPVSWEALPRTTGRQPVHGAQREKVAQERRLGPISARSGRSCQSEGRIYPASLIRSAFGSNRERKISASSGSSKQ